MRESVCRCFLDRLTVDSCREIDGDEVAVLHSAIDTGQRAEPLTQRLQLLVDGRVIDLQGIDRDIDGRVIRKCNFGANVDLGGECELVTVLDLGDLDLRLADRLDVLRGHSLRVACRECVVDDLLEHGAAADPRLEQLGRSLARTEARQTNLLRECLVGAVEIRLELLEGHLNVDTDSRRAELLDGALHGTCSFWWSYLAVDSNRRHSRRTVRDRRRNRWRCGRIVSEFGPVIRVRTHLVGVTGIEPATLRSQSGCATKLRHTPSFAFRTRTRRKNPRSCRTDAVQPTGNIEQQTTPVPASGPPRPSPQTLHAGGL